jgi:4-aminobutyrate aminotransferase-like enzyme
VGGSVTEKARVVVRGQGGTFGNVLRFLPPLTISDRLLADAFDVLEEAFG